MVSGETLPVGALLGVITEEEVSDEELDELTQLSSEGPSKETLTKAAHILRERFFAKRAGEERDHE